MKTELFKKHINALSQNPSNDFVIIN